jgi:hypothetical protein
MALAIEQEFKTVSNEYDPKEPSQGSYRLPEGPRSIHGAHPIRAPSGEQAAAVQINRVPSS